jgi:hypothetical protein
MAVNAAAAMHAAKILLPNWFMVMDSALSQGPNSYALLVSGA